VEQRVNVMKIGGRPWWSRESEGYRNKKREERKRKTPHIVTNLFIYKKYEMSKELER
jgi:hypothetical protein